MRAAGGSPVAKLARFRASLSRSNRGEGRLPKTQEANCARFAYCCFVKRRHKVGKEALRRSMATVAAKKGGTKWRVRSRSCLTTLSFCLLLFSVTLFQIHLSFKSTTALANMPPAFPSLEQRRSVAIADSRDLYHPSSHSLSSSKDLPSRVYQPRVVSLSKSDTNPSIMTRIRTVEALSDDNDASLESQSEKSAILPFERRFYEECIPMTRWQSQSFPTCNALHEIEIEKDDVSLLSLAGSWRSVWKMHQTYTNETVVLKLLKHSSREFNKEAYEHHRIDALVMERLTKSPHIVDVYGYCGQSALTEYATGLARDFVKNEYLHSLERLEIGRDMAQAVADLHSIDYSNATNATFAHNDMNMANAVEVNGRIKLNDFNIGILQRWNKTDGSICHTPVRFRMPLWKSPEENANTSYVDAAATDVYGLGNLLFHVLTKRQPWTHLEPDGRFYDDNVTIAKLAGRQPYIPPKYTADNATKTAYQALYYAVMQCFQQNPLDRPTSHQLASRLEIAARWVQRQQGHRFDADKMRGYLRELVEEGIV